LDLSAVTSSLSISERFLRAIEEGRLDDIPGGFFARSFVRQYATFLGAYDERLERALRELVAIEDNMPQPPVEQPSDAPDESNQSPARKRLLSQSALIGLACLVVAVAAPSILYLRWDRSRRQPSTEAARVAQGPISGKVGESSTAANQKQVEPAPPSVAQRLPDLIPAPQAEPGAPASDSAAPASAVSPPEAPEPAAAGGRVVLELVARDAVWVSVIADGGRAFQGTLLSGQGRTIRAAEKARLVVGNAGALNVQWNGRAIGPIGPRGAVKILEFTPDTFDFVQKPGTGSPPAAGPPDSSAQRPSVED